MKTNGSNSTQHSLRLVVDLKAHPRAVLVPPMDVHEYDAFCADIAVNGILVPLEITPTAVVLDGHQRLRAAHVLGLREAPVRVVEPDDEITYILRAALHRRHLTASQRIALALELSDYEERLAAGRNRQRANLLQGARSAVATSPPRTDRVCEHVAHLAGVSPRLAQDVIAVKEADPELFKRIREGEVPAHRAARTVRQRRLREQAGKAPRLPDGVFDLIYADPPWPSQNPDSDWAPENHYPTMTLEEIKGLHVPAAEDAVLFLWGLGCHLPQAIDVLAAWGFRYVAEAVWIKQSIGLGTWVRYQHEPLLIAVRGSMRAPEPELRFPSVIHAPRREHSRKPEKIYELLERAYPHCSKLELFARGTPRPGWAAWGNEVKQ